MLHLVLEFRQNVKGGFVLLLTDSAFTIFYRSKFIKVSIEMALLSKDPRYYA